jgi:hypothetical protein
MLLPSQIVAPGTKYFRRSTARHFKLRLVRAVVGVKQVLLPCVLLLFSAACASLDSKATDHITPVAKNIIIYSAGGSVVSGVIDPALLGTRRLRLPPTATAINLYQNNESLKWFTIQMIQEPRKDSTSQDAAAAPEKYKLVGLPALKVGELKYDYALPEITWRLQLNAAIIDSKTLSLRLQAVINVEASQAYENCTVTLVLNNAVSLEKISGYTFNLNSFDLYPHRNITYNLDNKILDYSFIREWYTYTGTNEVHVLIQVKNPFSVDLNQTNFSVEANQINIESGSITNQIRPGETLSLGAGVDDTIFVFRSVKITEAQDKRALPFNHRISYEITNRSDQEKTLRLISQRVMGTEHKSAYHFQKEPDATPEDTIVWVLTLKPGSIEKLEYDYDADVKDVPGENGFEAGM